MKLPFRIFKPDFHPFFRPRSVALAVLLLLQPDLPGQAARDASTAVPSFDVVEASIADLQSAMTEGKITSRDLVQLYLARIAAYDTQGPRLNAIISINPKAMAMAARMDEERKQSGARGPLHGIPIILKDNFDTADMPTTAGTLALMGFIPPDDAFQVRKLREAGAVILAKANMHELASGITTISSLGGQTLNPYDPTRNPGGSSGGTGAAVAASFAAAGMGSDTCGSIRIPASHNNLVGLRPTLGLSSRSGIIPLSHSQDVGGPLARTVADLALMLDATVGPDPADPATLISAGKPRPEFAKALDVETLRGAGIGILTPLFGEPPEDPEIARMVRHAVERMKNLGATVTEIKMPDLSDSLRDVSLIDFEFKFDLADYLSRRKGAPVLSLGEILQKGLYRAELEQPLTRRNAAEGPGSEEARKAVDRRKRLQQMVLKVLEDNKLDVLAYPTMRRKPARIVDPQSGSNCQLSAATGFPAISMPAGFTEDEVPAGVELLGRPFTDVQLVGMAYAYEQATRLRRAPFRTPALVGGRAPAPLVFEIKAAGGEVVPAGESGAGASGQFSFDRVSGKLTYRIHLSNLEAGEVLFAAFHRGETGKNGPVVFSVSSTGFSAVTGTWMLSERDRKDLMSGRLYLNVATINFPAGAIRAQLRPGG